MSMFLRRLTGFRKYSLKHGHISKGALEGPSREMGPHVSTSLPTNLRAFSIPFRRNPDRPLNMSLSPLIQINSLRRSNNVFTSAI